MSKATIYLDPEDDITSVITKVRSETDSIVALVPPRRFSVFQSSVNLKLLKHESKQNSKKIVVITTDNALLPLAGSVGVYVADSLNSRPYLPEAPAVRKEDDLIIEEDISVTGLSDSDQGEGLKINENAAEEPVIPGPKVEKLLKTLPRLKGRVPNFNKFRLKLIIGSILVVLLAIGWYAAFFIMPRAEVIVEAQTNRIRLELDVDINDSLEADDLEQMAIKTSLQTMKKTFTDSFPTSGERNVGERATGLMTIRNCDSSSAKTIPSGTTFIASTGHQFASTEDVTVAGGAFSGGTCDTPGEAVVNVRAKNSGTDSNLAAGLSYTVSGFSSFVTAIGGKMSGGTNEIVKVVAQKDIDEAVEVLKKTVHDEYIAEIEAQFATSTIPITTSFKVREEKPKSEPAVGQDGEEVFVSLTYVYTMQGVSTESLETILEKKLSEESGVDALTIYDIGLSDASLIIKDNKLSITAHSFVGPKLEEKSIAEEISGLRFSAAKKILEEKDGVNRVTIKLNPFWVFSMPRVERIEVTIEISKHALQ